MPVKSAEPTPTSSAGTRPLIAKNLRIFESANTIVKPAFCFLFRIKQN
jgi:hypothetical protein